MARKPLIECTRDELLYFAQEHLNRRNVQPSTGKEKLIALIKQYWGEPDIEVPEGVTVGDQGPRKDRAHYGELPARKMDPMKFAVDDPRVLITVHKTKEKGGDRNVPCHLNGVSYWIPRGRKVEVPLRFFRVLEEAVGEEHPGWDDDARRNLEPREVQSYTYTIHRMPSDEEIEAWEKRMQPLVEKQSRERMKRIMAQRKAA